jgi:hypothetical protein
MCPINAVQPITSYSADILMHTDYYAFGQQQPARTWQGTAEGYRYSHNSQEKEDALFKGAQSAEYWMYDSRIGRRWERDPIVKTWESPYAVFGNNPILLNDLKGLTATKGESSESGKATIVNAKTNTEPKTTDLPEVVVKPKTFWQKVGEWVKGVGNNIGNFFKQVGKGIGQQFKDLKNWLARKDKENFTEVESSTHSPDEITSDREEGDGRPNPGDQPEKNYHDPTAPEEEITKPYDPKTKDNDGWTIVPDQSGHQNKKTEDGTTIFYRDAKSGDTVEINQYLRHNTNKNSQEWKDAVREYSKVSKGNSTSKPVIIKIKIDRNQR